MERRFSASDGMILMCGPGVGLGPMKASGLDKDHVRAWPFIATSDSGWAAGRSLGAAVEFSIDLGLPLGGGSSPSCLDFQSSGRPGFAARPAASPRS